MALKKESPQSGAAGAAAEPASPGFDPDATRVAPVAAPLGEMPSITAANARIAQPTNPPSWTGGKAARSGAGDTLPGGPAVGDMPQRQVGRYQIVGNLGRGGMASVYRAHDPGIGRDVAIKFLHSTLCEDDDCRARFLREARAAGGLSHPNIVTVHDVGEIDGRPYMAMEFLQGDVLSALMKPNQPLPVRQVLVMGIQLAEALAYAHAHRIVHRDIKPGNIVRLEGTDTIKVTDFGIAHMDSTETGEQRTRVGDVLGTPQYMSPEQTRGDKLDGRSDLFSVGIVLYQMLTGHRPFGGDSLVALAMKIANEEPAPLEKARPDLPPALRRIVERCLAKNPDRRFQSGRELSEALSRVLAEMDASQRERERPRIVPLRVKWAATMALVVMVVMGIAATVITQRQYAAMLEQVTGNGASLARFIAAQNAVAALGEDWPVVDVSVQEMMKTGDFRSITVVDRDNIVRADGDASRVGQAYARPAGEALGGSGGGVTTWRHAVQGEPVLGFEAPITFQGKRVGQVALGLAERPLVHVARLSMGLMAALVIVTVLAVAVAMYFVADWFARPIKLVIDSMAEIGRGHFEHRIAEARKDEFGLLFAAFDRMAQALQHAREASTLPPAILDGTVTRQPMALSKAAPAALATQPLSPDPTP
jgi:eukaryotic-like serine/threonine-protein kinase